MYEIKRLWVNKNRKNYQMWSKLLECNELVADTQVDYTIGIFNDEVLIGTASLHSTIIKCVSILPEYQGENLLSLLVTHLLEKLNEASITHAFLYTKPESATLFKLLGFSVVTQTEKVVFMEFGYPNFQDYLLEISEAKQGVELSCGIVMNANPFTLGHQFLIEKAATENKQVYVFVVSENVSEFNADIRLELVKRGTEHLKNVVVLPTRHYQVSFATFPSYFLKDKAELSLSKTQAELDARLFLDDIAPTLMINKRYVGKEPFSPVTDIYNQAMQDVFGQKIELVELDRKMVCDDMISATKVRHAIKVGDWVTVKKMVPKTTYDYIKNMR